jgi:hypothetical protein
MAARHEPDPHHLLHFSEDPGIERFVPHVPATNPAQPPLVWTVDDPHAPLFWFPRQCPRITFWTEDGQPADRLGPTSAGRVHAIEAQWLERVRTCRLFIYRFRPTGFLPWPDADGYWVSDAEQAPVDVAPAGDLLALHEARGIELRVVPDLAPLRAAVVASGLRFSMCRLADAVGWTAGPVSR